MIEYKLSHSMLWRCTKCSASGTWSCDGCKHIPDNNCDTCPSDVHHDCDTVEVSKDEWLRLKAAQGKRRTYQREYMQKRRAKKSTN